MPGPWNQLAPTWDGTTALTPVGEALFQQQAQDRISDDYDLRRAWAMQGGGSFAEGHLPDTGGKLPNHPTFSTESPYSTPQTPGGVWAQLPDGRWTFWPSQTNADQFGIARLQDYFSRVEPNSLLMPTMPAWSQ